MNLQYKDSGIEWIGQIPEHWEIKKIKFISNIFTGNSMNEETKFKYRTNSEQGYPYIATKDIDYTFSTINYKNGIRIPNSKINNFKIALTGSTLICIEGGSAGKKIGYLNQNVCFVNKLASIKATKGNNNLFLYYLIKSNLFNVQFNSYMNGLIGGVSIMLLKNIKITLPSLEEQNKIAKYLFNKTSIIEQLIKNIQSQINRLEELEKTTINKLITKGLNDNIDFKDSKIKWIGEIPNHWITKKIKRLTQTTSGSTPLTSNSLYYNGDIPWIRTLDLNNDKLLNTEIRITDLAVKETSCKLIPKESVLIAMYGGGGTIGKHSLLMIDSTINQAVCAILPRKSFNSLYLYFNIKSYRPHWMKDAVGTRKDPNINQDIVKELVIPVPPLKEQEEIAKYLDKKTKAIQTLIKNKQQQVKLYKELRKTVINNAVTGKIIVN